MDQEYIVKTQGKHGVVTFAVKANTAQEARAKLNGENITSVRKGKKTDYWEYIKNIPEEA